jgi:4-diphosphocytidyl-2-C-methyl-D-erythritol kinase
MSSAKAFAKINLALVVGPLRADGKHEIATLLQRIDVHDTITLGSADHLEVEGFDGDTMVRAALEALGDAVGVRPRWRARVEKRIPVAAGLGGGSSDAATALRLANDSLPNPLSDAELHRVAASLGADVPFFLGADAKLATGDGTELASVAIPSDYTVVLVSPDDVAKESTGAVYAAFDVRGAAHGFDERAARLERALRSVKRARDLAGLPPNDLASSPLAGELEAAGAFRADVSGAGPTVYGLFEVGDDASRAAQMLSHYGRTVVTRPVRTADLPGVAR